MAWKTQLTWWIPVPLDLDTQNYDAGPVALKARPDKLLETE